MLGRSCLRLYSLGAGPVTCRSTSVRITTTAIPDQARPKQAGPDTSKFSAATVVKKAPLSWQPYLRLMRVDKPTGTWLLFWPCAWSIGLAAPAGHLPSISALALFGAGSFLMRAGGCVINDLLDQKYDKLVERTKYRPLPSGELTNKDAMVTLAFLLSGSLAVLLQFNWFSVAVGASSLAFAVLYPYAKRYTYWPQIVLGFAFNFGVVLGWTAVRNSFDPSIVFPFYFGLISWTLVYDTIYALQDKADDIIAGVKSTALLWGEQTRYWLTGFGTLAVCLLYMTGIMTHQTWPYYLGLAGTAGHLGWQIGTLKIHEPVDCWSKFRSNQWMGIILFCGIVCGSLLKPKDDKDEKRGEVTDEALELEVD